MAFSEREEMSVKMGSKAQQGFTLIEVSLAIVIGVIVLAGAITLYNQSKVSAGNSKASAKTLALAGLAEEMSASNNGAYPTAANLETAWVARRDDARANPWGGALGANQNAISRTDAWAQWNTTSNAVAGKNGPLATNAASAGVMVYLTGTGPTFVYDTVAVATRSFSNFFVGIADNNGQTLAFVTGGK